MKPVISALFIVLALGAAPWQTASAYVGPGAGLSLLGALWGLLIAVAAALGFIILWPLRQAIRRARAKRAQNGDADQVIFNDKKDPADEATAADKGD